MHETTSPSSSVLGFRTSCLEFFQDFMVSFRQYAMVYIVAFAITVLSIILNHAVGGGYFFIEDTDRLKALLQSLTFTLPLTIIGPIMKAIRPSFSRWYVYLIQLLVLVIWLLSYFLVQINIETIIELRTIPIISILLLFAWLFWWSFSWALLLVIVIIATQWEDKTIWWWCNRFIASLAMAWWHAFIICYGTAMITTLIQYLFNFNIVREFNLSWDIKTLSRFFIGVIIFLMRLQSHGKAPSYSKIFRFISLYILTPLASLYWIIGIWKVFFYSFSS